MYTLYTTRSNPITGLHPYMSKRKHEDKGKEKACDGFVKDMLTDGGTEDEHKDKKTKTENFRLNSGQLFLTYSQCGLALEDALLQVTDRLAQDPEKYLIAQERHQVPFPFFRLPIFSQ